MPVTLKGTRQGIVLRPLAVSWADVLEGLANALQDAESFFRGGRVILEMEARELRDQDLVALRDILNQYDMELWAVLSENEATIHTARTYGLRTRLPGEGVTQKTTAPESAESNAMFVQRTLRSGQSIKYPGHIILLGDVNPGAEIIAGGSIVVWGKLRGLAHAGALGDESTIICALELRPSQLRIAGYISRGPQGTLRKSQPEVAKVVGSTIVAEPWTTRE